MPSKDSLSREPILDLLRYFAALLVFLLHLQLESGIFNSGFLFHLKTLALSGGVGVPIFFIISGYVITLTALRTANPIKFIWARFIRLFPGLFFSMLVVLIVGSRFIHTYQKPLPSFFTSITLTYNIYAIDPLTSVLWTLLIEIRFYFLIFILLFIKPSAFKSQKSMLLIISILSILHFPVFGKVNAIDHFLNGNSKYFFLGICIFYSSRIQKESIFTGTLWIMFSVYFAFDLAIFEGLNIRNSLIIFSVFVVFLSRHIVLNRQVSRFFSYCGLASYPMYLIHTHVGVAIKNILDVKLDNSILILLLCTALLTTISFTINRLLEAPLQALLRSKIQI